MLLQLLLQTKQQEELERQLIYEYIIPIGVVLIAIFIVHKLVRAFQFFYASRFKKPLFNHVYFKLRKLTPLQLSILKNEYTFYRKLSPKHQVYFEHRVATFLKEITFIGKQELQITEQMKVIIAATSTLLNFGFRNYRIKLLDKILLYPTAFYSKLNENMHKGEFNPSYKAIVLSWEDVLHGYSIDNDNFNVAIHEFVHAMHLDCLNQKGLKAAIFINGFSDIAHFIETNEDYKNRLIESEYFRDYAYTNQFEFLSVIIETFIETPGEFKRQFPELYRLVKRMLNFNFANY